MARPSGNDHWTRQPGVKRRRWKKFRPADRTELIDRFLAGESQSALARDLRIGRTTVWRYLREQGLVKVKTVSGVPRFNT